MDNGISVIASDRAKMMLRVILTVAAALIVITVSMQMYFSIDILFEVSTGNQILESGIFYKNPITIDPDLDVVIQQWLFDVIMAVVHRSGMQWVVIIGIAGFVLLFLLDRMYLKWHGLPEGVSWVLSFLSCFLFIGVTAQACPEGITLILLLLECTAFEQCRKNRMWLLTLPAGMVLEANFHASMILFHFAIAAAYLVPSVVPCRVRNNGLYRDKYAWIAALSMIPAMFLNPYGVGGVLYLYNSLRSGTFYYTGLVSVFADTTGSLLVFPFAAAVTALTAVLTVFLFLKKRICNHQFYLSCGFILCAFLMARNYMFLYLVLVSFLPDIYDMLAAWLKRNVSDMHIFLTDGTAVLCSVLLLAVPLADAVFVIPSYLDEMTISDMDYVSGIFSDGFFSDCDEYIRAHSGTDVEIFAGSTACTVFEYLGYSSLLFDCRPELYMSEINGSKDILAEYTYLCCRYLPDEYDYGEDTAAAVQVYLGSYGFDYLIITDGYEVLLQEYLDYAGEDSGYKFVMDSGQFSLYERAK